MVRLGEVTARQEKNVRRLCVVTFCHYDAYPLLTWDGSPVVWDADGSVFMLGI
ncbi:hypothetical protein QJS10_CPB15g00743 [Acorus calamus]|uniref:Uncharacterized protein n=1 Tax=Acorus calamus TaxID=4465 RepID=A0AAV9D4J9_ACOCL|nr:hypothetical protein QJS10_CPB15g00743 [Acorus calamus]